MNDKTKLGLALGIILLLFLCFFLGRITKGESDVHDDTPTVGDIADDLTDLANGQDETAERSESVTADLERVKDLERREAEVNRRETEIIKREIAITERERLLLESGTTSIENIDDTLKDFGTSIEIGLGVLDEISKNNPP